MKGRELHREFLGVLKATAKFGAEPKAAACLKCGKKAEVSWKHLS